MNADRAHGLSFPNNCQSVVEADVKIFNYPNRKYSSIELIWNKQHCGFHFQENLNSVIFLLLFATLELYFGLTFKTVMLKFISRYEISLISNVLKNPRYLLHTSIILGDGIWVSFLSISFNPVCFINQCFISVHH